MTKQQQTLDRQGPGTAKERAMVLRRIAGSLIDLRPTSYTDERAIWQKVDAAADLLLEAAEELEAKA